jgi:hypothetical protein
MISALKSDLSHFTGETQDVAIILLPRQILLRCLAYPASPRVLAKTVKSKKSCKEFPYLKLWFASKSGLR